ncbi:MAG: hypothetical protein JO297_12435 [Nitrososphaeraceae archaeon]|nr:hypothetical protein [Nitrososphaeraceae archaeon]
MLAFNEILLISIYDKKANSVIDKIHRLLQGVYDKDEKLLDTRYEKKLNGSKSSTGILWHLQINEIR